MLGYRSAPHVLGHCRIFETRVVFYSSRNASVNSFHCRLLWPHRGVQDFSLSLHEFVRVRSDRYRCHVFWILVKFFYNTSCGLVCVPSVPEKQRVWGCPLRLFYRRFQKFLRHAEHLSQFLHIRHPIRYPTLAVYFLVHYLDNHILLLSMVLWNGVARPKVAYPSGIGFINCDPKVISSGVPEWHECRCFHRVTFFDGKNSTCLLKISMMTICTCINLNIEGSYCVKSLHLIGCSMDRTNLDALIALCRVSIFDMSHSWGCIPSRRVTDSTMLLPPCCEGDVASILPTIYAIMRL